MNSKHNNKYPDTFSGCENSEQIFYIEWEEGKRHGLNGCICNGERSILI